MPRRRTLTTEQVIEAQSYHVNDWWSIRKLAAHYGVSKSVMHCELAGLKLAQKAKADSLAGRTPEQKAAEFLAEFKRAGIFQCSPDRAARWGYTVEQATAIIDASYGLNVPPVM